MFGVEELEGRQMLASVPQFDHVVIVVEENQYYESIIGSSSAPYINSLAQEGALFSNSFGVTNPSQLDYLSLFSGSPQGIFDNNNHGTFGGENLYTELSAAGKSFAGYFESIPYEGYTGDESGLYVRKHNPVIQFDNVPGSASKVFGFPTDAGSDFSWLPTVSLVVPNEEHNMHNGSNQQGDDWLRNNLDAYAQWAKGHNSLLIVTWDEDDRNHGNHIPTVFYGANVQGGTYSERIDHYNVLRTIEEMYGTTHAGNAANAPAITDVWNLQSPPPPPPVYAPWAPTELEAQVEGENEVRLSWHDNSGNEAAFKLERSTDNSNFSEVAVLDANVTAYDDTGVAEGSTYWYRIYAVNDGGASDRSNTAEATTTGGAGSSPPPPPPPTGAYSVTVDASSTTGVGGNGTWYRSAAVGGFVGGDYLEDGNVGKGGKSIRFSPELAQAGTYEVRLRWTSAPNRARNVPVEIAALAGKTKLKVDERAGGGQFVTLGRFNFDPAMARPLVTIRTAGTRGFVVVDALELVQTTFDPALSRRARGHNVARPLKMPDRLKVVALKTNSNKPRDMRLNDDPAMEDALRKKKRA